MDAFAQPQDPLLDVRSVAKLLACSTRHVLRLADGGKLPRPIRVGTLLRWRREDLAGWIASGCRPIATTLKINSNPNSERSNP